MGATVDGRITLAVPPERIEELSASVKGQGLKMILTAGNLQRLIDDTTKRAAVQREKRAVSSTDHNDIMDHSKYHRYTEIVHMLQTLEQLNPDLMQLSNLLFRTHEGREVKLVKLHGNSSQAGDPPKPAVIIEAGIHAREWISPAVNLWVIDALIQGYRRRDTTITAMLDHSDWYIIPVTNPDGYEFSHKEDRLWRKNRRYISLACRGVDLNRNFDVKFNTTGVSGSCNSGIYLGYKPFSEPESSNVKALVENLQHRLVAYVSAHSYSQGSPRLPGLLSGQGAGGGAQTRDRRVPANLKTISHIANPQGSPRLPGLLSGQGAGGGAQTRDRRVPANLKTVLHIANPQGSPRLPSLLSGQGAGGGAQTRDRRVPANLKAVSLATMPPTPP
ncbi:Zinc carboxypeptidase [Plakobranchus ocellatus]|uniref:Zinc carboxypeptidase n=1 Tax=Plakobranchus ocellatus TaxID=259542 RepID=A0AAV4CWS1_9GAST|nr:Zinc carboxypeptidase [Plakobranchus ocellatus]